MIRRTTRVYTAMPVSALRLGNFRLDDCEAEKKHYLQLVVGVIFTQGCTSSPVAVLYPPTAPDYTKRTCHTA